MVYVLPYGQNITKLKLVDAMGFEPILGISPVRLPQTPCLFGFMHPLKLVEVSHKATQTINGGHGEN